MNQSQKEPGELGEPALLPLSPAAIASRLVIVTDRLEPTGDVVNANVITQPRVPKPIPQGGGRGKT